MTRDEFKIIQSLPLLVKKMKSIQRVIDAINVYGVSGLYVSHSGGKDSQVLYSIVQEALKLLGMKTNSIPRVFCDTGLEWSSVRKIGNESEIILKPDMAFNEVVLKYGYPVVSKEQSQFIYECRNTNSQKLKKIRLEGGSSGMGKISEKWKPLLESDFKISDKCCTVMKKKPFKKYEKETGRIPILGILASESQTRLHQYLKTGCNAFDNKRPLSKPLGFWTEQDILKYIKINGIKIASIYGDIIEVDLFGKLQLTKQQRTGCVFCMYGAHRTNFETFEIMKREEPKKYDYCMNGGKYDKNGLWIPYKGLGLRKVIDDIKKYM